MTESIERKERKPKSQWPDEYRQFALQKRGYLSPAQIGAELGVSRKSVYHFFQDRDLNPMETVEGWITIAEYARRLGVSHSVIYEKIERGEVEVITVDGSKRKWIKQDELVGKTGQWLSDNTVRAELRQAEGKSCINCGSFLLERRENNTCGSLCRSEQSAARWFKVKHGFDNPGLILPPHLRIDFQDKLEEMRLLIRWPWLTDRNAFPFRKKAEVNDLDRQIKWVLASHRGRVVTTPYIGAVLAQDAQKYGLLVDPETNRVPISDQMVQSVISCLEKPDDVVSGGLDEWIVAAQRVLSRDQQVALRFLVQHKDRFIKSADLESDMNRFGASLKSNSVAVLGERLADVNRVIEDQQRPVNSGNTYYRLVKS